MIGIELVTDRSAKEPARELCDAVLHRAFHNGLILLSCGTSTVRFMPPLMITKDDVDEAFTILEASFVEALEGLGSSGIR
jgi:4-aminobutyrate aminotransferase